jgi:hypothetical protein
MTHPHRRTALLAFLCLLPIAASAAPLALDAGLRASIYDENYKLGVGGELGAIAALSDGMDIGAHFNYSHFAPKTENRTAADEFGGYAALYFKPKFDQAFWLRIGPHLGYSRVVNDYVDLGGDAMAVFKATPTLDFYGAFIPSYFIGKGGQTLIRIGLGIEYRTGG